MLVNENPGSTAARLARALAVSAPNITMWLDKLRRRGLMRREASETDRRSQHLYLTDKGRKLAEEATRRVIQGSSTRSRTSRPESARSWWSCFASWRRADWTALRNQAGWGGFDSANVLCAGSDSWLWTPTHSQSGCRTSESLAACFHPGR